MYLGMLNIKKKLLVEYLSKEKLWMLKSFRSNENVLRWKTWTYRKDEVHQKWNTHDYNVFAVWWSTADNDWLLKTNTTLAILKCGVFAKWTEWLQWPRVGEKRLTDCCCVLVWRCLPPWGHARNTSQYIKPKLFNTHKNYSCKLIFYV